MSTTLWVFVAVFVVLAIAAGAVQIFAALGDRRHARTVTHEPDRLHTDPLDPQNPGAPGERRS